MNVEEEQERLDTWAEALSSQGYLVAEPLPPTLLLALQRRSKQVHYQPAQVGRQHKRLDPQIRSDRIAWTNAGQGVDAQWMQWLDGLQRGLNQRLFLGLAQHESHYAWYPPGASYQRHRDAFATPGHSNRVVSLVLYLNASWPEHSGGELVLYPNAPDGSEPLAKLEPSPGRMVLFMSAELPHQVLPGQQDRYSLAAWFRGFS